MLKKILLLLPLVFFCNTSHANCWEDAGVKYNIDPWLLYSIAKVESGHKIDALNINKNHTMDVGLMQINSIWFPVLGRYGIRPGELMNGCNSIHVGAWILAQSIQKYGYNWVAIGSYHSQNPQYRNSYAYQVFAVYQKYRSYVDREKERMIRQNIIAINR